MAKKTKTKSVEELLPCTEVELDDDLLEAAAYQAIAIFPPNAPSNEFDPTRIGVLATKFWGSRARDLTVGFMQQTSTAMISKVLAFANMWGEFSNVRFRHTQTSPIIRISFGRGGYWSYLGTDLLSIPANRNNMNLEGFTVNTRESEWHRVVKHEFGHALGCPHEQQRREILALLDEAKVIAYFKRTQNWTEQDVRQQILIPLEERSLMGASPADVSSIMCYSFPGSVTKSGQPIPGGNDFSPVDKVYFGKTYPKDTVDPVDPDTPPPPPPPPGGSLVAIPSTGSYKIIESGGKKSIVLN